VIRKKYIGKCGTKGAAHGHTIRLRVQTIIKKERRIRYSAREKFFELRRGKVSN